MRIAVITAITNAKDQLSRQPANSKASYIAFLDEASTPVAASELPWQIRPCWDRFKEPRLNAKIHKVLPHLFVDCDISIWIDANISLRITPEELVQEWLGDEGITVFKHFGRGCIYEEAREVVSCGLDAAQVVQAQMRRYRETGYPESHGLAETGVIVRRHVPEINRMNERWWAEICGGSSRDQLSFPVCFPRYRAMADNPRESAHFNYRSHLTSAAQDHQANIAIQDQAKAKAPSGNRREIIIKPRSMSTPEKLSGRQTDAAPPDGGAFRRSAEALGAGQKRCRVVVIAIADDASHDIAGFVRDNLQAVDQIHIADRSSQGAFGKDIEMLRLAGHAVSAWQGSRALTRVQLRQHLLREAIEYLEAAWVIMLDIHDRILIESRTDFSGQLAKAGVRHAWLRRLASPSSQADDSQAHFPEGDGVLVANARLLGPYLDRYGLSEGGRHMVLLGTDEESGQTPTELDHVRVVRQALPPTVQPRRRVVIFSGDRPEEACARIRLLQPLELLHAAWEVVWAVEHKGGQTWIDCSALAGANLVVIQRLFPKAETAPVLEQIFASGAPVIYEADDLLLDVPAGHPKYESIRPRLPILRDVMDRADLLVVSTELMRRALEGMCRRVVALPNALDLRLFHAPIPAPSEAVRLGIAGTPTHARDYGMIARALERVVERYGERVRIVFMGDPPPGELAGMPSVTHLPYVSNYECHAERLRGLGLDVALAPLVDTPFNHAKSNIKWLEYSACGIAGIYSDLPPYDSIRHGETGLKVANTEEAWYAAIATLIEHPELRERIAKNAQMEVVQHHSAKACKETFDRVYREALRLKARPGGGDR